MIELNLAFKWDTMLATSVFTEYVLFLIYFFHFTLTANGDWWTKESKSILSIVAKSRIGEKTYAYLLEFRTIEQVFAFINIDRFLSP